MKFIILSNQYFDFELKTNKWHVATRLAQRGHEVVFVDPPLRFKALKNFLTGKSAKLFGVEEKANGLKVYKPVNLFNFWPFSIINTNVHANAINNIFSDKSEPVILYIYHFDFPDLENFMKKINYDLSVYDCVDEYTAFPDYSHGKKVNPSLIAMVQSVDDYLKVHLNQSGLAGINWVLHREKWLSDKCDLVFVSAPGLIQKFKDWGKNPHYLPNAAPAEVFDKPQSEFEEPEDIKNIPHPRIGFSGAIDTYKNNISLIEKSVEAYPDYHFVLIGPEKVSDPDLDLSRLKSKKNVHFLGIKPWEKTPAYFAYFDAYFIPYNLNEYTVKGCFPIKYFEALAAGLPTLVTNMPAYEGFDPDGYVAKSDGEFVSNIERALKENSAEKISARKIMAHNNSWNGKVDKILNLIQGKFHG